MKGARCRHPPSGLLKNHPPVIRRRGEVRSNRIFSQAYSPRRLSQLLETACDRLGSVRTQQNLLNSAYIDVSYLLYHPHLKVLVIYINIESIISIQAYLALGYGRSFRGDYVHLITGAHQIGPRPNRTNGQAILHRRNIETLSESLRDKLSWLITFPEITT